MASPHDTNELLPATMEKHSYRFDDPLLSESGFVQVFNKGRATKTVLHFPARHSKTQYLSESELNRNFQLFVNGQSVFSFNFLPILTWNDFLICQNMFYKAFTEIASDQDFASSYQGQLNCELTTAAKQSQFTLNCHETINSTTIELNLHSNVETEPSLEETMFQIQIGAYTPFCAKTNLPGLSTNVKRFILSFILHKLNRY